MKQKVVKIDESPYYALKKLAHQDERSIRWHISRAVAIYLKLKASPSK